MITQELVKSLFEYIDGDLIRKISGGNTKKGDKVGSINGDGYLQNQI